ncbi:cysteine proteinase [Polyporus arcularius HHB13444]|uniref:Cysteine proteinase n=1 Tax=Polyporus arcularius HHB13444 TaxID=1314778 RepID=A0A5C3P438_9APHY|nr:cysteine proteinase [Polyporus arcularius HHB13444]
MPQDSYHKGAVAELAKDFNKAFRMYVKATEQYLLLSNGTADVKLRSLYKAEATKSLERAEKIKAVKQDLTPVVKDELSPGEQMYVIRRSSLINQGFFPPWDSQEPPTSSSEQPPLSAEQVEQAAKWCRPRASHEHRPQEGDGLDPQDVTQHIVSDCSVCAALVVAIDHDRRFSSKMILSSLHPQAESGQFQCKLLFNGTFRRVGIDDQLPVYPDGTLMCVSTRTKGQLWPSLIEKAYMKLAGGYDFVGSALAGWIPEALDMKGSHFQRERTWDRLMKGYVSGTCVATLGTGEQVRTTDVSLALLPTHCYAIIGVSDSGHDRRLTIFDPWVPQHAHEGLAPTEGFGKNPQRTVELSMDAVYQLFDGIYLSWDPSMFKHQLSFHGYAKDDYTIAPTHSRMQVHLNLPTDVSEGEEVWVLLTRHVRSHRSKDEYIALTAHTGSETTSAFVDDALSTKGEYTNSPHVLVKQSISRGEDLISLVASYEGEREDVGYTITVYSNLKASAIPPQKLLYTKDIDGAFTQKSAGGNHTFPTYYLNPQYHLHVHPRTDATSRSGKDARDAKATVYATASTDRHVPVNIMLAWSQGGRINELGHNDLALSSGPYSYGYAHALGRIPPGDYTLVVSVFEPRHIGKFALRLECSDRFDITPIQQEGAGMFSKVARGEWAAESAGGGPSSGKYTSNPMYELNVSAASQLKLRLQLSEPSPSIALNLTIFNTSTGSTLGRHIATSGPYSDVISGVVIEKLTLQPGRYLVVPSTFKPGVLAGFRLIVYSTASGVQLSPVER